MHRFLSLAMHVQVDINVFRTNTIDKAIQTVIQHYVLAAVSTEQKWYHPKSFIGKQLMIDATTLYKSVYPLIAFDW